MPELPEVETTRRGIAPHVVGQRVMQIIVRDARLRWPVQPNLKQELPGQAIRSVERRAKYLLLRTDAGTVILHLGMSGNLRILPCTTPPKKHDHVDIMLANGKCLRLHDPRRFGTVLWTHDDPLQHPLLANLGPEPLEEGFDGDYLFTRSRGRTASVKQFLMDSRVVAGVGNIYANEALFLAGIHPTRAAGKIARARYEKLAQAIKQVLQESIVQGGTTLRDFLTSDGHPGYFSLHLRVYGRAGEPCPICGKPLLQIRQGQRSTYYCRNCQR